MAGSILLGLGRLVLSTLPDMTLRPLFLAVGALVVTSLSGSISAVDALSVHSAAAALSLLLALIFLKNNVPNKDYGEKCQERVYKWWPSLWSLTLIVAVQLITQNIDILLLGFWTGDAELGLYRVALSVAQISVFGVTVGNMIVQAQVSGLSVKGEREAVQQLLSTASRVGCLTVTAAWLILVPFGSQLLSAVFGNDYALASRPLAILLCGAFCMSFVSSAGMALAMLGGERELLHGAVLGLLAKCFLSLSLAPSLGMDGAAIANAISVVAAAAYWAIALRKCFGFRSSAINVASFVLRRSG
jgi:O-antigen/teichoic acid export membrane protein